MLIVALLGVSSIVCVKGIFETIATRQVDRWFYNRPVIYTSQLTNTQKDALCSELQSLASKKGFVALGRDSERLQSGALLCALSMLSTKPNEQMTTVDELSLLGTTIVDDELVKNVCSSGPDDYAGYGNDAFSRISDIPSIRSGLYFCVKQMKSGDSLGMPANSSD